VYTVRAAWVRYSSSSLRSRSRSATRRRRASACSAHSWWARLKADATQPSGEGAVEAPDSRGSGNGLSFWNRGLVTLLLPSLLESKDSKLLTSGGAGSRTLSRVNEKPLPEHGLAVVCHLLAGSSARPVAPSCSVAIRRLGTRAVTEWQPRGSEGARWVSPRISKVDGAGNLHRHFSRPKAECAGGSDRVAIQLQGRHRLLLSRCRLSVPESLAVDIRTVHARRSSGACSHEVR